MLFGAGRFFKKTIPFETYFDQSVQGLEVGAPVKYLGVKIGEVKKISILTDEYPAISPSNEVFYKFAKYVVVYFNLDPHHFRDVLRSPKLTKVLQNLVSKNGLRVRLDYMGITGVAFLGIDNFDPKRFPPMEIQWQPQYQYIPSISNPLARLGDFADAMMTSMEDDLVPVLHITHKILGGNPQLGPKIDELLDHSIGTMKNLEEITASAKKYPSQFVFGQPPPKSKYDQG